MSPKLRAYTFIRKAGIIERASEARYIGCYGVDHVFGLANGDICAVDLVTSTFRLNGVAIREAV